MDITTDTSVGKWLDKSTMTKGLSISESTWRLGIVGENVLHMDKPTVIKSIIKEFQKPFYLYQVSIDQSVECWLIMSFFLCL